MSEPPTRRSTESSASPRPRDQLSSTSSDLQAFDYQAWGPDTLAPIIPIKVKGPNGEIIEEEALIDSGADSSAFPLWTMSVWGIRKKDCKRKAYESSGGRCFQWIWPGTLNATILGRRVSLAGVFADTPLPLLGRDDFFHRFEVAFDQRALKFYLAPYDRARP